MRNIYTTREETDQALSKLTKVELYNIWVPVTHLIYDSRDLLPRFMIDDILDIWFV